MPPSRGKICPLCPCAIPANLLLMGHDPAAKAKFPRPLPNPAAPAAAPQAPARTSPQPSNATKRPVLTSALASAVAAKQPARPQAPATPAATSAASSAAPTRPVASPTQQPLSFLRPVNPNSPLGPIETFLQDPTITEIMINDLRGIMVERQGKLVPAGVAIAGRNELDTLVRSLELILGKALRPDAPFIDGSLPDGSRVHIVAPPASPSGPCITIRKFPSRMLTPEDLIQNGLCDAKMLQFLTACIAGRINILVSGGTGSGKTTLLNALLTMVPKHERIVTIEDTMELRLANHPNSARLLSVPPIQGQPGISARDLLVNAMRMRPDRIVVGECRRSEAFDMLQAMNTGHEGSMTTLHANTTRDALARLETLCLLAGVDLPLRAVRKQVSSAIDLIVQIRRFRDGKRRIVAITELTGMEAEVYTLQEIFVWDDRGYRATGFVPTFLERLKSGGAELPPGFFG